MDAAVASAVWVKLESRFADRPVALDEEEGDNIFGISLRSHRDLRIHGWTRSTHSRLLMAACATVQVEPGPKAWFRLFAFDRAALDRLHLLKRLQAGVEKQVLKEAQIINRSSRTRRRTRRVAANSRICGHETSIEADGRAEQQERKNRAGDFYLRSHRCPPWWDMADTQSFMRHKPNELM